MIVVGVGCGPGHLTEEGARKVREARSIYGSKRAIELASAHIAQGCEINVIKDYSRLNELPSDVVLLSTGDPMLAGLGHLGSEVVPGISSMQLAFARLRLDMGKVSIVSGHGKEHSGAIEETAQELKRGKIVFLLTEPAFPTNDLFARLRAEDMKVMIATCEDLGYPEERIAQGSVDEPPEVRSKLYSLVIGAW